MPIIDLHCDTIAKIYKSSKKEEEKPINLRQNDLSIDIFKLKEGNYLAQCFAMFVPFNVEDPFQTAIEMIDVYYSEIKKNSDFILPAYSYKDIMKNKRNGKMSAILTIEEGGVCKGSIACLRAFYKLGVRLITLNWNFVNGVGHPNFTYDGINKPNFKEPNKKDGLTDFGIAMVKEMNRLGMIVDVSHLSDKGFYDVYKYSKGPFVASHSNSRTICEHCRNLTDDMIKKIAKRKGVIGINYAADFLHEAPEDSKYGDNKSMIIDMIEHIKYIKSVGGIECIALGSDFDGIYPNLEMQDASQLSMLTKALKEENFSDDEIEMITYKNALRVFKAILK